MFKPIAIAVFSFSCLVTSVWAGDRKFTYTYDVVTAPKGHWEYEQWVTWKAYRSGSDKDRFDFRHELEVGVTDRLQLGLYLSDWSVTRQNGSTHAVWKNAAVEAIYNLTNPTTDFLGSALYGEVKLGDELFVLEGKLLLQKNLGPWTIAYNAIIEAEWEGPDYQENIGVFGQTAGVSFEVSPGLGFGVEAKHEVEYENWSDGGDHVLYVGPVASWSSRGFFIAGTVLLQVTGIDGEADVQTRIISGFHF